MRQGLLAVWLGLVLGLVPVLTGCGGGGGGGSGLPPLTAEEEALVGSYALVAFDWRVDGIWYDEFDFLSWGGDLAIGGGRDFYQRLYADGYGQLDRGTWYAYNGTFEVYEAMDQVTVLGAYAYDGVVLAYDYIDPITGDRQVNYWQRVR